MYKLLNTRLTNDIKNQLSIKTSFFSVLENYCFYSDGEKLYIHLINEDFTLLKTIGGLKFPMKLTKTNNYFFLINTSGKSFKLKKTDYRIEEIFENLSEIINDEIAFCYEYNFEKLETQVGVYSIFEKKSIWFNYSISQVFYIENCCFGVKKQNLAKIDLKTGHQLWHFSLSTLSDFTIDPKWQESEVRHFVGVIDGVLWVDISCYLLDDNSIRVGGALLGLDIDTGTIVHFLHQPLVQKTTQRFETKNLPTSAETFYDKTLHKLIGFSSTFYWEVDLSAPSPELKLWNFWDDFALFRHGENVMGIAFLGSYQNCGITDTHIFSPVGSAGMIPQIFAFNRLTHQVDWRHIMQSEHNAYYMPTKVQVSDNHLFVLDSEGTLHIFAREAPNN